MSPAESSRAATQLSAPREQGTLAYAYRRSVVALSSIFGGADADAHAHAHGDREYAEREPLLASESAGPSNGHGYGATDPSPSTSSSSAARARPHIRKPKRVVTQSKVEAKVWFANERTWISWLRVSVLIGSFALALFNSSTFFNHHHHEPNGDIPTHHYPSPSSIKIFGAIYAAIAILTLLWGLYSYQRRLYLIKTKYPGDFDDLYGPPIICAALFIAVLFNFILRVQQRNLENEP